MTSSTAFVPPMCSAQSATSILEQDNIIAHFQDAGKTFLGNAELKHDFHPVSDGKDAKNVKFEVLDGVLFFFELYGVLLPQSEGTKINVVGNYNGGEGAYFRPIRDGNAMGRHVKDVHAIGLPQWGTAKLRAQITNSISTLNDIEDHIKTTDSANGIAEPAKTFDWVKSSDGQEMDTILIQSPNKYAKPNDNNSVSSTAVRRTSKINLDSVGIRVPGAEADEADNEPVKKTGTIGAWYPPSVQPDYGGPFFELRNDMLKQQEVYDADGDLVHPENMYDVLRPGTLIEYICEMHIFNIDNKNSKNPGYNRYYQIQFRSAHVLWQSAEPACPRSQPDVPIEFKAFIANQAPQIANSRITELQTYAQKKRAVARMRTTQVPPSAPSKTQPNKPRNNTQSEKAKGKKKASQDNDEEQTMACN